MSKPANAHLLEGVHQTPLRHYLSSLAVAVVPIGLVTYPLVGVVALFAFLLLSRQQRVWRWCVPFLGLTGAALLAALLSDWPLFALQELAPALILAAVCILWTTRLGVRDAVWVGGGLAVAAVLMALKSAEQVFADESGQATGFAFHPNIGAGLALVTVFGILGAFGVSRHWGYRTLLLAGLTLAVAAIVLSGSRGAYLALPVGLVSWCVLLVLRTRLRWALIGLALVLGAAVLWLDRGSWPLENWGRLEAVRPRVESLAQLEGTGGGRAFMGMLALEMAAERPLFGHGFGAWQRLIPEVEPSLSTTVYGHSHNLYTEILLDGGTLTLVAFLMFLGAIGWQLLRRAWRGNMVAAASFAALVAFAVNNLFDVLAYQPHVAGLFWIVLSLGLLPAEGERVSFEQAVKSRG